MKTKKFFVLAVFLGCFFIWQNLNSKILISEIKTSGTGGANDEYVELYNNSSSSIILSGYYLRKMSSTGNYSYSLGVFSSSNLINPFSYFLVAHSEFSAMPADRTYSSNSLADSNNGILLFKEDGVLEDILIWGNVSTSFSYGNPAAIPTNTKCLSRLPNNENGNGQDTGDNSVDFIESNCDPQNSLSPSRPFFEIPTTTTSTDPTEEPTTTTPSTTPNTDFSFWTNVKINEFACAPEGDDNEWVEFFNNSTSSLDLSGGYLCDERGSSSTSSCKKIIIGTVLPLSWFVFDLDTRSFLNNDKDSVILRDPLGQEIDKIVYSGSLSPKTGQSLARKIDGKDTDNDADWAITTSITKNSANIITAPSISSGGGGSYTPPAIETVNTETSTQTLLKITGNVVLNEVYPDPEGSDTLEEFIEIKNIGEETINLAGWTISDLVKKYTLSGSLASGEIAVYKREKTGIALNNTTAEEVKLADSSGKIVDKTSYNKAFEGQSYMRDSNGIWLWTAEITPGRENKLVKVDNLGITVNIKYPKTAEIGEMVIFDASESSDSRGGQLSFLWNFSDNLTLFGEEISRTFPTSGIFTAKLTVISTLGDSVDKTLEVKVDFLENLPKSKIIISEILPNPEGADKGEFIELYNLDEISVDLSGWKLKNKNNKTYIIPEGTKIGPKGFLILYQEVTKLTLTNTEDKITLLDDQDEIVDLVKYEKAPEGKSYSFFEGNWFWSEEINPGRLLPKENNSSVQQASIKITKSKTKIYQTKTLAQVRESEVGDLVITQGVVAVLPNIFSSQYFYIVDKNTGIQIYSNKKDYPDLKIGDLIKVKGEVSIANGAKRIKTKTKNDFVVLKKGETLSANNFTLDELSEENFGALVKIVGEIVSIKTNYLYLDDGNEEIQVYFKKNAGIDKKNYKVGEVLEVTGIFENSKNNPQLWPRSSDDLQKTGKIGSNAENEEINSQNNSKQTAKDYLLATFGGFSALFFGVLFKNKGTVIKGAIALAGRLIKKG